MITIGNSGAEIASTNYWETEQARKGFCYLSGNAGTWRLLVPPTIEPLLGEMKTGKSVTIERSLQEPARCWDVVFEDGTSSPFALSIDKKMVDRAMEKGSCRFSVWTIKGKVLELACTVKA